MCTGISNTIMSTPPPPPQARDEELATYCKNVTTLPIETILEEIRLGKKFATEAVANLGRTSEELAFRHKLIDNGLIGILLELLKHCEHMQFSELFIGTEKKEFVEGPAIWMTILSNSVIYTSQSSRTNSAGICGEDGGVICVEIAEGIESLVKCMHDDMKKELFQSNEYWYQTYPFFIILVTNLVMSNNKAMAVLLQYENGRFIGMLIQYLFFEKYRADIMEDELARKWLIPRLPTSCEAAMRFLYLRVAMITHVGPPGTLLNEEQRKNLYEIGVTPVVSEAFDPKCSTSFMRGIVDLVKKSKDDPTSKQIYYYFLSELAVAGCVDSDVIKGVIKLGMQAADKFDADQIPRIIYRLIHVTSMEANPCPIPDDNRFAVAISSGLLQVVLKMLVQFDREGTLATDKAGEGYLDLIVQGATRLHTHPKTSKAITKDVCISIEEMMTQPEMINLTSRSAKVKKVWETIGFLINSDFKPITECYGGCSKVLEGDAIKRCSKCKNATYCKCQCLLTCDNMISNEYSNISFQ